MVDAVDIPNSECRTTLVTGLKWFGKTALISTFEYMANGEDDIYIVSSSADTVSQSILDDIAEQISSFTT